MRSAWVTCTMRRLSTPWRAWPTTCAAPSEAAHGAEVRVSLIKPGNIVTGMSPKPYGEDEPAVVVRAVRHALGPAPKRRYLAGRVKGWPVGLLCWIFTHMPSWLTDNLM